ncbi:MAG: transporter substrate-binding domain-containing protein [Kordiimonadaceae bacterium]|nr:transporter substrate-binding domain-containing protein [Kordiimonadaceae bacterium]
MLSTENIQSVPITSILKTGLLFIPKILTSNKCGGIGINILWRETDIALMIARLKYNVLLVALIFLMAPGVLFAKEEATAVPAGTLQEKPGPPGVAAQDERGVGPVKMGYVHFPPFVYTEKGKPTGIYMELARKIFLRRALQHEFIELPVKRLYKELEVGRIHVFIGPGGVARAEDNILVSKQPLGITQLNLYRLPATQDVAFSALKNTTVIVLKGYVYGGYITKLTAIDGVKTFPTTSHETAYAMLLAKRAPYVLDYRAPFEAAAKAVGVQPLGISQITAVPAYWVISKSGPAPEALQDVLEEGTAFFGAQNALNVKN